MSQLPRHGTRARYQRGCHCERCREANAGYHRERRGYRSAADRQHRKLLARACRSCGTVIEPEPVLGISAWTVGDVTIACAACTVRLDPALAAILAADPFGGDANELPAALERAVVGYTASPAPANA